jgi:TonB family protein
MGMQILLAWMFVTGMANMATPQFPLMGPPRPRTFAELNYPAEALAARVTGTVVVRVTTDASWRVAEAEALAGPEVLREPAVANARQWTLAPGEKTGTIVYRFEIDEAICDDDSRSLFRLVHANVALITACTRPGRAPVSIIRDDVTITSYGTTPSYPRPAKGMRVSGVVILDLSIDAKGQVTEARALSGSAALTDTAVAHAKTWRIYPTSARRWLVVYEFVLTMAECKPESESVFWPLGTNHVRLRTCGLFYADVTDAGPK